MRFHLFQNEIPNCIFLGAGPESWVLLLVTTLLADERLFFFFFNLSPTPMETAQGREHP